MNSLKKSTVNTDEEIIFHQLSVKLHMPLIHGVQPAAG
jgi:hypothetical protein